MRINSTKMKSEKILLIGHLAQNTDHIGGQTIKSRNVYDALSRAGYKIDVFDTYILKKNKLKILQLLYQVILYRKILLIPAQNNLRLLLPYIYFWKLLLNKKVYMIAVGGWLEEFIKKRKLHQKILRKIEVILLQNQSLTIKLREQYSFKNVETLHNFKVFNFNPTIENKKDNSLKIVFLGRILPEKGVSLIFELCELIKNDQLLKGITIDFIGPIEKNYKQKFHENLKFFDFANYLGAIHPDKLYPVMNKFDVMLFPTKYIGEGFPGVILDAFNLGIPVISTYWKDIPDIVDDGENGFLVEVDDKQAIYSILKLLVSNPSLLYKLKIAALESSKKYSEDSGVKILKSFF